MNFQLTEEEKEQILEAYSLFCGFDPELLLSLLKRCDAYGVSFRELYITSTHELKNIDFKHLCKLLYKIAVAKLNQEYKKYISVPPDNLPDPMLAFSNGKAFCTSFVFNQMKELFKYKTDLLNIINDLIERND